MANSGRNAAAMPSPLIPCLATKHHPPLATKSRAANKRITGVCFDIPCSTKKASAMPQAGLPGHLRHQVTARHRCADWPRPKSLNTRLKVWTQERSLLRITARIVIASLTSAACLRLWTDATSLLQIMLTTSTSSTNIFTMTSAGLLLRPTRRPPLIRSSVWPRFWPNVTRCSNTFAGAIAIALTLTLNGSLVSSVQQSSGRSFALIWWCPSLWHEGFSGDMRECAHMSEPYALTADGKVCDSRRVREFSRAGVRYATCGADTGLRCESSNCIVYCKRSSLFSIMDQVARIRGTVRFYTSRTRGPRRAAGTGQNANPIGNS